MILNYQNLNFNKLSFLTLINSLLIKIFLKRFLKISHLTQ